MELFGFVLSFWAITAGIVFFIAMVIASSFDRRGAESPKWWVFCLTMLGVVAYSKWAGTLSFGWLTESSTWKAIGIYLGIGVVYAAIEFFLSIRKAARQLKDTWSSRNDRTAESKKGFVEHYSMYGGLPSFIKRITIADDGDLTPVINRKDLAESIGCWTIWWPFYAVSLIIGDLLTEIFRVIADFFVSISGRFVKKSFNNAFKV